MFLLRHLPNFLTCCNLLCGCLGLVFIFNKPSFATAYFIWLACVFDFFDGFAARMLNVSSPIGKQLDSLADMVSFGIVPAALMFRWMSQLTTNIYLPYLAFSLAVFSALRLAKFNIDENQSDSFIGVPTPANALFITALTFVSVPIIITSSLPALVLITLLFSFLLVAPFNLFALKFKNFSWADNRLRFTFLLSAVLLLAMLQAAAIPIIILLYILVSLVSRAVAR